MMFDQFLLTINAWMVGEFAWAVVGAFLWGIVSVLFSPCHLASIPLIVGYVAGQNTLVDGKKAAGYAIMFSTGLFISIAIVGFVCTWLGRMLGDISPLWGIPIGVLFVWLGLSLMGIQMCTLPSGRYGNIKMRGHGGAIVLGLSYGVLSGACTFGFIAPILAMAMSHGQQVKGLTLILSFAIGHCLPIVIAGSSVAIAQRLLSAKGMQSATVLGRKLAGGLVIAIGLYFVGIAIASLR